MEKQLGDSAARILELIENDGYSITVSDVFGTDGKLRAELRFYVDGYEDWLFGMWVTPLSEEDSLISIFGSQKKSLNFFMPKHANFSFTDICSNNSTTDTIWFADSFTNTLQMIKNSGCFVKWIFNKKAHETGIIKYLIKSLFTWKK